MAQEWMLLNLDKRERSWNLGKMAEFWHDGPFLNIKYRLLVPANPLPLTSESPNDPSSAADANENQARQSIGGWAGDRLICVGSESSKEEDYPAGTFTDEELQEVRKEGTNLFAFAEKHFTEPTHCLVSQDEAAVVRPKDRVWVFRNLSKSEYVRLDDFEDNECGYLENLVVGMTACSTSTWGKYLPGDWAGNRFDVNEIGRVREEGWKDVTDDVVDLLAEFW